MDEELKSVNTISDITLKDYKVKPLFKKKSSDIIVAVCLTILSIFGVSALFWDELSLGYAIVFDLAIVLTSVFLIKKGEKPSLSFILSGLLSLICSWSFFITSNPAIKAIMLFATAIAAVIWLSAVSGKEYKPGDYNLIIYFFAAIYRTFNNIASIFKSLFSKDESRSKTTFNILIGIACAIPAVLIIIPILSHADDAFDSLIGYLFDDYFTLIQKVILGLGASVLVISLTFSLKYDDKSYSYRDLSIKLNNATASAFLCVLCLVYAAYLFSQLAYFFSAFSSILPANYKLTYAEYARRGFFELCIISVINLVFIFSTIFLSEKKDGKLTIATKLPSIFIIVFTFIIIVTALSKMVMYINAYGCTVLRLSTSAFMIWLFILFVCILVRIFKSRFDIMKIGLVFALIILAVLGIGNINSQIAKYNYSAYKDGKIKMDVEYMADIGDEGIPYLYKLTKDKDADIAKSARTELSYKYYDYYYADGSDIKNVKFSKLKKTGDGVFKYTIARQKAYKTLEKYAKEQKGKVFVTEEIN